MLKQIATLSGRLIPLPALSISLDEENRLVVWIYPQVGPNRFKSLCCTLTQEELPEFTRFYYAATAEALRAYFGHELTFEETLVPKAPARPKMQTFTLADLGLLPG